MTTETTRTENPASDTPWLHLVLVSPQIPPNTGNIIRLCANTGARLHLVKPLGFSFDDTRLRRAGLDYHEWATVEIHESWEALFVRLTRVRLWAIETGGDVSLEDARFGFGDAIVFGNEPDGLTPEILAQIGLRHHVTLPMRAQSRSLNLSNAAAVTVYYAWRQHGFVGAG